MWLLLIAVALVLVWLIAVFTSFVVGGLIHLLLLGALVVLLVRFFLWRRKRKKAATAKP